jgi:phosphatidylglycerol:prolipoprotein diacylglycerol transferase
MLYELAFNLSIFLFLWFGVRKREHRNGFVFALYLGLYSVGRFIVEHFRADSLMMGPLKAAQMVSIVVIIVAAGAIVMGRLWEKPA